MPKPSAVVFDLGKVLLDFDYGRVVRRFAAESAVPPREISTLLLESGVLHAYERGQISSREFFTRLQSATGFPGDYATFAEFFADIFTEIPAMISLHADLRARGVPTYIFSNTNDLAVPHIRARYPFFSTFDGYVLSYEVRSMKPDEAIYDAVETMTHRKGTELIYLDDRAENIATALRRGWIAVHHHDPALTRERVIAAGLLD